VEAYTTMISSVFSPRGTKPIKLLEQTFSMSGIWTFLKVTRSRRKMEEAPA